MLSQPLLPLPFLWGCLCPLFSATHFGNPAENVSWERKPQSHLLPMASVLYTYGYRSTWDHLVNIWQTQWWLTSGSWFYVPVSTECVFKGDIYFSLCEKKTEKERSCGGSRWLLCLFIYSYLREALIPNQTAHWNWYTVMAIPAAKINISWESVGKHTQAQCSHHVFCGWKMPTGTFFFLSQNPHWQ